MSQFGETLVGGSPFLAKVLIPILLLSAIGMPFTVDQWNPATSVVVFALSAVELLAVMGLYNPRVFWWAWRGVTAVVALAYVAYLVTILYSGGPLVGNGQESGATAINALLGFLIIGLPSLWYTLFGTFTLFQRRPLDPEDSIEKVDEEGVDEDSLF